MLCIKQATPENDKLQHHQQVGRHHQVPRKKEWAYPGQGSYQYMEPEYQVVAAGHFFING